MPLESHVHPIDKEALLFPLTLRKRAFVSTISIELRDVMTALNDYECLTTLPRFMAAHIVIIEIQCDDGL